MGNNDFYEIDNMILTSANTLENKKIIEYKGLVTGESLIGSNIYKDLFSGIRDVVAGRTSIYEAELEKARENALKTMEEKAYKVYITDVVKSIAESFGASVTKRYIDLIDSEPEDERTGDEVAMEVIQRLGLKVKGGEES